jgi:hypothetical protein
MIGSVKKPFVGLDLYLWWNIQDSGKGFATRWRRGDGGRGAAWMDRDCLTENNCERVFAHEAGHFLGLCHVCAPEASPERAKSWCQCGLANHPLPTCPDAPPKAVMHPSASGTDFSPCEKGVIRTNAGKALGLNPH